MLCGCFLVPVSNLEYKTYIYKNHQADLIMYSDNKIALIICQKNDPELKKLRPFLPCSYWARSIHPCYCYSLKNMKVNAKFIYIVDNQNIPQFFDDILGHASRTNSLTFGLKSKKQYLAKMVL